MEYNPAFVAWRAILSDLDKGALHALSQAYTLNQFRADARNYEEMRVDFVYTSAKIEGNTYDRIDTDQLLRIGITAGGKRYSDAVMLINLRDGFDRVMAIERKTPLDLDYVCALHQVLMKDLLEPSQQGIGRTTAVTIGATRYRPLADPGRLRTERPFILSEAEKYTDPFERAIYLHCNLAYLQYFKDGNKRTARMMQTAALVRSGTLPLFFNESFIGRYQRSVIHYYETGEYEPYVDFFKENYRLAVSLLSGQAPMLTFEPDQRKHDHCSAAMPNAR